MMRTHARIEGGKVVEIVKPLLYDDGSEIPVVERFVPEFVATLVDITDLAQPPSEGMSYDGEKFFDSEDDSPTSEQILERNSETKDSLLSMAYVYVAPLQLSISLGDATPDEIALAKSWQAYCRALNAIDLQSQTVDWPSSPIA